MLAGSHTTNPAAWGRKASLVTAHGCQRAGAPRRLAGPPAERALASLGGAQYRRAVPVAVPATSLLDRLRAGLTWGGLAVAIWAVAAVATGIVLGWASRRVLRHLTRRLTHAWDEQFVARLRGPLTVGWTLAAAYVGLAALDLAPSAEATARRVLQGAFVAALFWVLLRSIDVGNHLISSSAWATRRLASKSFVALAAKALKIGVVIVQVVTLLSLAGYPVGSLIAGLGIGGLALALGAQKTLEHVFGAFALAVDQPFQEGDFVKIDGVLGTVEGIGLRSTRIRTLDRTMVAIPNGKLADMRTETFAARDRLRLACTLSLTFGTTGEQMRRVLAAFEARLRAHPKVGADSVSVRFTTVAASSLDVEIEAWFATTDWNEFQAIRQDTLLGFIEDIGAAGAALALPTRTVLVAGGSAAPAPGAG
jgi:MscS family membrane protein